MSAPIIASISQGGDPLLIPPIELEGSVTTTIEIEGHAFRLAVLDERPDVPTDPVVLMFVDLEDEPRLTLHVFDPNEVDPNGNKREEAQS